MAGCRWLDSRSNSNIRKSTCAGERHVFGTCLGYGALVNSTTPIRGIVIANTRAICLRLPVHEQFIVIIKANTIHDIIILNSWFVGNRR